MTWVVWFAVGVAMWSGSEYVLHRFVGHGRKRTPPQSLLLRLSPAGLAAEFNREHLAHHADPSSFAPTSRKLLAAAVVIPALFLGFWPLLGAVGAAALATGFGFAYGSYELLHRRVHTCAPSNAYGRWRRRHHLLHHHKTPRENHGVTSPVWDVVFGTLSTMERVRVPKKHAPAWLLDDAGQLRAQWAGDYELVAAQAARGDVTE